MTEIEMIERNKLIAEFRGYRFSGDGNKMHFNITKPGESLWYFASWEIEGFNEHIAEAFKYHSSWDALMPILALAKQKIIDAGWATIDEKWAKAKLNASLNEVCNVNIENAHYCLIKFIQWYNEHKTITQ